jgi:hypothetical protein
MERERTFNPSACGSKPPGSAILLRAGALRRMPFVASAKKGANLEIIGPVTVAAERGGLLIRWLAPTAGSNPAWSSNLLATVTTQSRMMTRLYPNWQRECVESAFSGRSSRPRRTNSSSVTHLVRRPVCLTGERDSISLRSANYSRLPCRVTSFFSRSRLCSCA